MSGDRKPLISGNWKMNHNHFEAIQTVQKLAYSIEKDDYEACDVSVHPPFTDLRSVQTVLQADSIPIALGAQNVHQAEKGAFTGEVSAGMLDKLDVKYVIVGHSERRELFDETDEVVNAKAIAVLQASMTPIVCVGETLEERTEGRAQARVTEQLTGSLASLKPEIVGELVIAYEPIWAIGTGETATPADAQEMCAHIRAHIAETFGAAAAAEVRIQYGGSVKPGNAPELMAQPDIDGALVGGASLDADDFARIVKYRIYQA
ncbi:MAG: triose-phosphate isomerase [Actinomycetota bacterium]